MDEGILLSLSYEYYSLDNVGEDPLAFWPDLLWFVYRQNAFQVIAVDGICSGIIQCLSGEDCIDWLQAIATNISNLTKHNVSTPLKCSSDFPVVFHSSCHEALMGLNLCINYVWSFPRESHSSLSSTQTFWKPVGNKVSFPYGCSIQLKTASTISCIPTKSQNKAS